MSHIVMLLSNAYRPDPRVSREAQSLIKHGYRVSLICWDRQAELSERETQAGVNVIRVHDVRSSYGSGWRQLFYTPRFWSKAIHLAVQLSPDLIHCHDLDTLYAGVKIKRLTGCPLIYDAHEDYPALMTSYLPKIMVKILTWWQDSLQKTTDCTITASTYLAEKFRANGIKAVTAIGNYQPLEPFDAIHEADLIAARADLGIDPDELLVVYIGGFSRNRLLLPLIEAVKDQTKVHVIIWGDGHQREAIETAIENVPEVRYLGWLPFEQVPKYTLAADMVYYCLDPNYPGAVYNAPNTLSIAMAAGRPIIANDVGDLGRTVRSTGCGLLLTAVSPETVRSAINELRDPLIREKLGQAGRSAAETTYNWSVAEESLIQLYERLSGEV